MASVVQKYMTALRQFGWKETLIKMYTVGDVKFGTLMGMDRNGNKYYENTEYPFGQHRWVEYADIHNFEPTSITPDWHGWIHHQTDEYPTKMLPPAPGKKIVEGSDAPYQIAKGYSAYEGEAQLNWSTHRSRGYGVGSLKQGPNEPDKYYKQPGHPTHPDTNKGGRFTQQKGMDMWDPEDPEGKKGKKAIRDLSEV